MIDRTLWFLTTKQPSRRWCPKTLYFTTQDIENLKTMALSGGKKSTILKQMKLSTNDIITALFWKIRATLNSEYAMDEPIICTMVINTRSWLPERFPKRYLGNALAFLPLHATRGKLIHRFAVYTICVYGAIIFFYKKSDNVILQQAAICICVPFFF
ncbi:hypothetical protein RFI_23741 [Reticulomyxa filosa]|uniref:Uncharacterized protein n=1 Tax=Reticulomyxa filosa TaxID=46433 RepID=X6MJK9_RETFI|nr:hypothetical protein RFI_23741 [Reticulomyxa filosa]|eukprot:ETO13632.1 hypothetical protein RFI_23741 [Reticulomyxa filosa]